MKRIAKNPHALTRALGLMALAAVLSVGSLALVTEQAEAGGNCTCPLFTRVASGWGTGVTCQASKNACLSDLWTKISQSCAPDGDCYLGAPWFTNECEPHEDPPFVGFMSDCRQEYTCYLCIPDM